MDKIIRCSGVPEHFNLPWKLLIEGKELQQEGLYLEWIDNPEGTGSLCQEIKAGNIDIAVLLLEGAIKNIHEGLPATIFSTYVESPLTWGVHTTSKSPLTKETLSNPSFAISRPTSGSHLMAYLYARNNALEIKKDSFEIVNNLEGAKVALPKNKNQLFLWEKYTTKPLVDSGIFNRIDVCPTPWPAFVIVVKNDVLEKSRKIIEAIVSNVLMQAQLIKKRADASLLISNRYGIEQEDAAQWLKEVKWAKTIYNDHETINIVTEMLLELGILDKTPIKSNLVSTSQETTPSL